MIVRAYIVTEKINGTGGEVFIAARLNFSSAMSIAKLKGNRRVTKYIVTKDDFLSLDEEQLVHQFKGEQYANHSVEYPQDS